MLAKLLSLIFGVKPIELWVGQVWTVGDDIDPFKDCGYWEVTIEEIRGKFVKFSRNSSSGIISIKTDSMYIKNFRKMYPVLLKESEDPKRWCGEESTRIMAYIDQVSHQ